MNQIGAVSVRGGFNGEVFLSGRLGDVLKLTETQQIPIRLHKFGTNHLQIQAFKASPVKHRKCLAEVIVAD